MDEKTKKEDEVEIEERSRALSGMDTSREREQKLSDLKKSREHAFAMKYGKKKEDHDDEKDEAKGEKTLTGKKSASVDIEPDIEEKHKKKVHSSKTY